MRGKDLFYRRQLADYAEDGGKRPVTEKNTIVKQQILQSSPAEGRKLVV